MSELIRREDAINAVEMFFKDAYIEDADVHCTDMVYEINHIPAASPWHRVEEPPKEHGPFLCAAKYERNGQTHWFFELCWYADGDLKDVVFDAEQDSGFYSWSESQDRDLDAKVDYWMPIEPPKE